MNLKYFGWPYREYIKTAKNVSFWEEIPSGNDFEAVLVISVIMTVVPMLLRHFRRLAQGHWACMSTH